MFVSRSWATDIAIVGSILAEFAKHRILCCVIRLIACTLHFAQTMRSHGSQRLLVRLLAVTEHLDGIMSERWNGEVRRRVARKSVSFEKKGGTTRALGQVSPVDRYLLLENIHFAMGKSSRSVMVVVVHGHDGYRRVDVK